MDEQEITNSENESSSTDGIQQEQELDISVELEKLRAANRTLVADLAKIRKQVKSPKESATFDFSELKSQLLSELRLDNALSSLSDEDRAEVEEIRMELGADKAMKHFHRLSGQRTNPKPHVPAGNAKKPSVFAVYDRNEVPKMPEAQRKEVLKAIAEKRAGYKN